MIDFNPAWIYSLAESITKAELAIDVRGIKLSGCLKQLIETRSELNAFLHHQPNSLLPNTCDDLIGIIEAIDAVLPPEGELVDRILSFDEVVQLVARINRTIDTFERECTQKYIVGLEKQRALEPKTLIEEIASALSPECWKRLSALTKREIEECGKCLAFERYTASGFHILRGIESEVTDYIYLLTHAKPHQRNLGSYIQILKDNAADAKLIFALDNIRNLDRNPLMHPEDWLSKEDAIGLFNIAQVAFERLIADMEKKKLVPISKT